MIALSLKIELILFYVFLIRQDQLDFQDNNLIHHFPEESDERQSAFSGKIIILVIFVEGDDISSVSSGN